MTVDAAIDALLTIAAAVFPYDPEIKESPETNMKVLKTYIEDLLEARNIPPGTKLGDRSLPPTKCKVCVYSHEPNLRNNA
jgi:hypothetical protein